MRKGVVLEIKSDYAVIGSEGHFIRVQKKDDMSIGQQLVYLEEDIILMKTEKKFLSYRKLVPAFFALFLAVMMTFSYYTNNFAVFAIVTVDINPSVELRLNKNQEVIKAIAINDDALELGLEQFVGLKVEQVIEQVVIVSKAEGFLNENDDSYIMVTTVNTKDSDETYDKIKIALEDSINEISNDDTIHIGLGESTEALLEEAAEKKMPLAVLNLRDDIDITQVDSIEDLFVEGEFRVAFESDGKIIEVEIKISLVEDEDLEELLDDLEFLKEISDGNTKVHEFIENTLAAIESGDFDLDLLRDQAEAYIDAEYFDEDSDYYEEDLAELLENLELLKVISNDNTEINEFVERTLAAIKSGDFDLDLLWNLTEAYIEAEYDDSDTDFDEEEDLAELLEDLELLRGVSEDNIELHEFVERTLAAIESGDFDIDLLRHLTEVYIEAEDIDYDLEDDDYDLDEDDDYDLDEDDDYDLNEDEEDIAELLEDLDMLKDVSDDDTEINEFIKSSLEAIESGDFDLELLRDQTEDYLDSVYIDEDFDDEDDLSELLEDLDLLEDVSNDDTEISEFIKSTLEAIESGDFDLELLRDQTEDYLDSEYIDEDFDDESFEDFDDESDEDFDDESDEEFDDESNEEFDDESDEEFDDESDEEFDDELDEEFDDELDEVSIDSSDDN